MGYRVKLLKKLFCKHTTLTFIRNIHGDEINMLNGTRSEWRCCECGKIIHKPFLFDDNKLNFIL